MPRLCNIQNCLKTCKWKSIQTNPTIYICNDHSKLLKDISFQKIVNSPCKKFLNKKVLNIKEARYGTLVKGKIKKMVL